MRKRQGRHLKVAPAHRRLGIRDITYRSLAEKSFAVQLDLLCQLQGLEWDYEPKVTFFKGMVYSPDFGVRDGKKFVLYHEIKAFRRYVGKTKITWRSVDPRWPTLKKTWKAFGPTPLKVWRQSGRSKFHLVDTINPEPTE